jgi:Leucine-rich repeat (LRR) protein
MEGINCLVNLKTLDLSNNKIKRIQNLDKLQLLEEFWFNGNDLSNWEDIDKLKALPHLKCLYLEHNPIYYINNVKPSPLVASTDKQVNNANYRRKIIFTLPNLEQLDASLCRCTQ